jgi:hypothetical protein
MVNFRGCRSPKECMRNVVECDDGRIHERIGHGSFQWPLHRFDCYLVTVITLVIV